MAKKLVFCTNCTSTNLSITKEGLKLINEACRVLIQAEFKCNDCNKYCFHLQKTRFAEILINKNK